MIPLATSRMSLRQYELGIRKGFSMNFSNRLFSGILVYALFIWLSMITAPAAQAQDMQAPSVAALLNSEAQGFYSEPGASSCDLPYVQAAERAQAAAESQAAVNANLERIDQARQNSGQ